jgi:hypothetical protein
VCIPQRIAWFVVCGNPPRTELRCYFLLLYFLQHYVGTDKLTKVKRSGENLRRWWKIWGFWNSFLYKIVFFKTLKIPWGTPYSWPGVFLQFYESLTSFYTKMSFKIALLFLFLFLGRTHCSKYCIIVQFHHAFSILPSSHARHPCPASLPGILARQPCPADLPGSLARKPYRYITGLITGRSLARQNCKLSYGRRPAVYCKLFPQLTDIAILSLV